MQEGPLGGIGKKPVPIGPAPQDPEKKTLYMSELPARPACVVIRNSAPQPFAPLGVAHCLPNHQKRTIFDPGAGVFSKRGLFRHSRGQNQFYWGGTMGAIPETNGHFFPVPPRLIGHTKVAFRERKVSELGVSGFWQTPMALQTIFARIGDLFYMLRRRVGGVYRASLPVGQRSQRRAPPRYGWRMLCYRPNGWGVGRDDFWTHRGRSGPPPKAAP